MPPPFTHNPLRGAVALAMLLLLLSGCLTARLVEPYDPAIDQGLMDYRQSLNRFVLTAAAHFGQPAGTYEANVERYAELQADVGTLAARARANAAGSGCRLALDANDALVATLGEAGVPTVLLPDAQADSGTAAGCSVRLMQILELQQDQLQELHSIPDPVTGMTGIRPATAEDALAIMNQAIEAAWVVERAKRREEE